MAIVPGMVLVVFSGMIGLTLRKELPLKKQLPWAVLTGMALAFFWQIREDSVWILPFLVTVREDETPGYILIPDGSGALIRYHKAATYTPVNDARIYGRALSVHRLSAPADLVAKRTNDHLTGTTGLTLRA